MKSEDGKYTLGWMIEPEHAMFHCPRFAIERTNLNQVLEGSERSENIDAEIIMVEEDLASGFLRNRENAERAAERNNEESKKKQKHGCTRINALMVFLAKLELERRGAEYNTCSL